MQASSRAAVTGANHPKATAGRCASTRRRREKSFRSIFAEGCRRFQDRNWVSISFISFDSFIIHSLQGRSELLQAITITARRSIGRKLKQIANLLERILVPNLQ